MRGLLWLLGAVLLLGSIDGGDTYEQLDANTRDFVDKAIIKANEKYGQKNHIDFHSISCSDNSKLFHFILKPTSCNVTKGAGVHQKECTLQKKLKPWVSCVVCGENMACERHRDKDKINKLIKNVAQNVILRIYMDKEIQWLQRGKEKNMDVLDVSEKQKSSTIYPTVVI